MLLHVIFFAYIRTHKHMHPCSAEVRRDVIDVHACSVCAFTTVLQPPRPTTKVSVEGGRRGQVQQQTDADNATVRACLLLPVKDRHEDTQSAHVHARAARDTNTIGTRASGRIRSYMHKSSCRGCRRRLRQDVENMHLRVAQRLSNRRAFAGKVRRCPWSSASVDRYVVHASFPSTSFSVAACLLHVFSPSLSPSFVIVLLVEY